VKATVKGVGTHTPCGTAWRVSSTQLFSPPTPPCATARRVSLFHSAVSLPPHLEGEDAPRLRLHVHLARRAAVQLRRQVQQQPAAVQHARHHLQRCCLPRSPTRVPTLPACPRPAAKSVEVSRGSWWHPGGGVLGWRCPPAQDNSSRRGGEPGVFTRCPEVRRAAWMSVSKCGHAWRPCTHIY
jgi:hypothetical protein